MPNGNAQLDINGILQNARDIATLQEQSATSRADRRNIWNQISMLRQISQQNAALLAKQEAIETSLNALSEALLKHKTDSDSEILKLRLKAERNAGAWGVVIAISGGVGGAAAYMLHWALAYFWPAAIK